MFYSQHVLTKKGPLAKIWLAAHMQTKITKAMVFSTDIRHAVDSILQPPVPMALRLTSNLLLGIVRILHRKSKYLLQESSDAMTKLKLTFRSSSLSATAGGANASTANYNSITLPNAAQTVDSLVAPDLDLANLPKNTSQRLPFLAHDKDITIDEFAGGLAGGMLDAFALDPDVVREDPQLDDAEPLLFTPSRMRKDAQPNRSAPQTPVSVHSALSSRSVEVLRAADGADEAAPVLSAEKPPDAPDVDTPPQPVPQNVAEDDDMILPPPPPVDEQQDIELTPPSPQQPPTLGRQSLQGRISEGDELLIAPEEEAEAVGEGVESQIVATLADVHESQMEGIDDEKDQPAARARKAGAAVLRKRKRKATVLMDYDATELSAAAFRACLMDTSDLVRHHKQRRRVHPPIVRLEDALKIATRQFAPELRDLFADTCRMNDVFMASPISSDVENVAKRHRQRLSDADADADADADNGAGETAQPAADKEKEDGDGAEKDDDQVVATASASHRSQEPLAIPEADMPTPDAELPPMVEEVMDDRRDTLTPIAPPRPVVADDDPPLPPAMPDFSAPESSHDRHSSSMDAPAALEPTDTNVGSVLREVAETAAQVDGADVDYVTEATISARTRKMQHVIATHLEEEEFGFSKMASGDSRRTAARCFYELLNLSGKKAVQLRQEGAYGDIFVKPIQPTFDVLRANT